MRVVMMIVCICLDSYEFQNIVLAEKGPHSLDKRKQNKTKQNPKLCKMEAVVLFWGDQRASLGHTGILTILA